MWQNYLTIALRNLRRYKGNAFINIIGLAVGVATCFVIALYVRHERSYDRFHEEADRIYRVTQDSMPLLDMGVATTPRGLAHRLETGVPGVERVTVLFRHGRNLFAQDDNRFFLDNVFAVDEQFFQVFSFPLLRGNPEAAFAGSGQAVLTTSTAAWLFGDEDPVGQVLIRENDTPYRVTGIVADPPRNSHFRFNVLLSLSSKQRQEREQGTIEWGRYDYYLYVLAHPESRHGDLASRLSDLNDRLVLQPLTQIHLYSDPSLNSEIAPQSDVRYLYLFSAVALLILLIACVNYVNLTTARSVRRAREVGIRKTFGAGRRHLIHQFIDEALLTVMLALPVALVMMHLALPAINELLGYELKVEYASDGGMLLVLAAITLGGVGLVAGSYPAFFLASFHPSAVLTGGVPLIGKGRRRLRQGLVVFQFAASVALIIGTMVVHVQMGYVRGERLGSEEHILLLRGYDLDNEQTFKQELQRRSHVASVSIGYPPGLGGGGMGSSTDPETQETVWIKRIQGDADYLRTLGLQLVAGENFSVDVSTDDEQGYIINETAARRFNITPDQVGTRIQLGSWEDVYLRGIVEDFHHRTLHEPIQPLVMMRSPDQTQFPYPRTFLVRLHEGATVEGLNQVEAVWNQFIPHRPFDFTFLDDEIEQQYRAEQRLARIFVLLAGLTVFVACLGLFGLAAYTAEQRTKEIGVRKVLGASVTNIVVLLSKDYLRLVSLAFVIAMPLAYLVMHRWLQNFAYRIDLSWHLFLVAGLLTLGITWLTVSYQSAKAARANPIDALRYE